MRVLFVLALIAYCVNAINITVDATNGPYKTFVQALQAKPVDEVDLTLIVKPGTYNFNATFVYQLNSLQILAHPSGTPVLTGKQIFGITSSSLFVLSGFIVRNTLTTNAPIIVKDVASVVLENNVFTGNNAATNGSCFNGNPISLTVTNCSFISNNGTYGAISVYGATTVTVSNSNFRSNRATLNGAGIFVSSLSNTVIVTVSNCVFDSNNAKEGTGISMASGVTRGSKLIVNYSNFTNNVAVSVGGAVSGNNINTTFDNCKFQNNTATTAGSCYGGALYLLHDALYCTNISNSQFIGNFASFGSAVYINAWTGVTTVARSSVYNSVFDLQQNGADLYAGSNNITVEKCLFTNSLYQSVLLQKSTDNYIKSTTIRGNNIGIYCSDSAFTITTSSVYSNTHDLTCYTCAISGQWSSLECSQGSCVRDMCSVCNGNGTQCLGCDGQVWSEIVNDVCGACGGNGTSCLTGCDNKPYSNATLDSCGVCNGNGTTCTTSTISSITTDSSAQVKDSPTSSKSSSNIGIIVGATIGGAVILAFIVFLVFFLVRGKKKPVEESKQELTEYGNLSPATPSHYSTYESKDSSRIASPVSARKNVVSTEDKYALDYSEIKFEKQIGEGSFGTVWKCTWRLSPVAVKQIKKNTILTEVQMNDFIAEAMLMRNMRSHRNVVAMLGMCMDPLCIVTEFCEQGSLISLLQNKKTLEMKLRIQILKDVAAGMAHLEKENIIHRDLAARNVLLGKGYEAKVSDFGLSRLSQGESGVSTISTFGPLKWWAFETLDTKTFTHKSDVWSFGVLCIEVLTRGTPYPDMTTEEFALQVIPKRLTPVNQIPKDTPQELSRLVASCFDFEPEKRPSFHQIFSKLAELDNQ